MRALEIRLVQCKSATSPSRLPGLDRALNPYRGCSHRCAYCYAQDVTRFELERPWGEVVEVRTNIVQRLKKELEKGPKGVYGIGTVTDAYQHADREHELTRDCLRLLRRAHARVSILTKSELVLRDMDILSSWEGAEVGISIGVPDDERALTVEPGAPSPKRRFDALAKLTDAGIDSFLMAAPILPGLSDREDDLIGLVRMASEAGVSRIMWDKFNPKPIANKRLQRALLSRGIRPSPPHSGAEVQRIRAMLKSECDARKIDLVEAF